MTTKRVCVLLLTKQDIEKAQVWNKMSLRIDHEAGNIFPPILWLGSQFASGPGLIKAAGPASACRFCLTIKEEGGPQIKRELFTPTVAGDTSSALYTKRLLIEDPQDYRPPAKLSYFSSSISFVETITR